MPINIGSLDNVPIPGDPITSRWAQDVSTQSVHVFASKAQMDAQWPTAPDGAHAYTITERRSWVRVAGVWTWNGPQGEIGYIERITDAGPITTDVALGGMTITVTVPTAGRRIRLTVFAFRLQSNLAGDNVALMIKEATTVIAEGSMVVPGSSNFSNSGLVDRTISPTAGAHTYNLHAARVVGTGTTIIQATAIHPLVMRAEDIGP